MVALFDRKRLEATWIEMASSTGSMMGMPAHSVGMRKPTKECGDLIIGFTTDNKMPMVCHHTISKQVQWHSLCGFLQNTFTPYSFEVPLFF